MSEKPYHKLNRIVVIGVSCSGKTTLAQTLAKILEIPHIELDSLHWLLNWCPRPLEEFRTLTGEAVAAERWVLDGNYSKARDIVWRRATTLIWLNYSFPIVFWRALYRTVRRVVYREKLYADNRETFKKAFLSKDSILWWVITTYGRRRREYPALFRQAEYAHLEVLEFHTPGETETFVANLVR